MSLRIVYGKSGSGKTEFIFREINERIKNKEKNKIYIITPEQFSFTAEKKLIEGKKSIFNVEVLTFKRMAYRVFNEVGGVINTSLSKCGKSMLIYSILQTQKNKLILLNKNDENVDLGLRTITEFKKHGIRIDDLKNEVSKITDKNLKIKLNDMILIYEKFEEKIKNQYIDETDLLRVLSENVDRINLFNNCIIYIDEFAGFTKQELEIIKKLLRIAKSVTITFAIDNLDLNSNPSIDIFYPNKLTLSKILNLLEKDEKINTVFLDKLYRFKNNELIHIENYLYNKKLNEYKVEKYFHTSELCKFRKVYQKGERFKLSRSASTRNNEIKNINLFLAKNAYSEIENVAKNIIYLIKNNNYRFNEITIITKNIDSYSSLIKAIFKKYEIPVFIDENKDLNQNLIIKYFLAILQIFIKNYSYDAMFNYIKSGFLEIDENDIFKLEKYCIKYEIKNDKWKNDFIYGINEKNKEEINYLNDLRKKIINPLIILQKNIYKEKNAMNIAKEFYLFFINEKIDKRILREINKLKNENNFELALEYENTLEIINEVLDQIVLIFNIEEITLEKFYNILKIGLKNSSLGKIPANQDVVIVGDTDRSRTHSVKANFIIGLNDGVFPSVNKNEGFFNDSDRELLKENGLEIAKGTLENLYDENYNIYKAFTVAKEKIFLSYVSSDKDGKAKRPSILISKIKKMFPNLEEESDVLENDKIEIICEKQLYENLINNFYKVYEDRNNLKNNLELNSNLFLQNNNENNKLNKNILKIIFKYFLENNNYKNKLIDNIKYINYSGLPEKIKLVNMKKLYGNKLITSVSKLEKYRSCPYSYFLQYELKLKEKEELKVQNMDTGTFMHEVIDAFFNYLNSDNKNLNSLDDEYIKKVIDEIVDEKLKNKNNYIFTAKEKYKLLIRRLKRIIFKSLKYILETLLKSEFKIEGTEIEFGENKKYEPINVNLGDGNRLEIIGKIDRIDVAKDENNNYVRIIDYKSSIKSLNYSDIYAGLQLQLITYLDAVCKLEDFVPAGVLYFSLLEQMIKSNKKLTKEEIEEKIKANFKMKGLILADVKVAKMHDITLENSTYSKIIPAYIDKEGNLSPKKSSVATREQFEKLQWYIDKTIKEISKDILSGNIDLKPYYKNKKTPCEYCSYKNMCGFNSGICKSNYQFIENYSKDEFFEKIEKYVDKKK